MDILPHRRRPAPGQIDYSFVTEFERVGNATFDELPIFFNI
jgi:hypothetical protein